MKKLDEMNCIACRGGDPPASQKEREDYFPQIPEWNIVHVDGEERLERKYKFKKYLDAVEFSSKIGNWAEKQDHHPSILLEWGKVTVRWWTHVVDGLHQNDFVSAAKSDQFYLEY